MWSAIARVLIGLGAVLLVIAIIVGVQAGWNFYSTDESAAPVKSAVSATSAALTKNDIQIDGWIDDRRVSPGDTIKFWIAIQNPVGAAPIGDVEIVAVRMPDFSIPAAERRCWKTIAGANGQVEVVPRCRDTSNPATAGLPERSVGAGGSVTIEGRLIAGPRRGKFGVSAVVGWVDSVGAHRRKPISIAPVLVESRVYDRLLNVIKIVQAILKDFALPLVLLWLGFWIKKIETTREESRKRSDDRIARVQQTWTLMLPKLHANTEKYYITLMSLASSVVKYASINSEYAFFFYASFFAQMKRMVDDITGFYLKNLTGEDLVSALWEALMDEADTPQWFGRTVREQLQIAVDPTWTFFEFSELLRRKVFRDARDKFVAQANQLGIQLALFELFSTALWFETNVCYVFWYGEPPAFPEAKFGEVLQRLKAAIGVVPGPKYAALLAQLDGYLKDAANRTAALAEEIRPA